MLWSRWQSVLVLVLRMGTYIHTYRVIFYSEVNSIKQTTSISIQNRHEFSWWKKINRSWTHYVTYLFHLKLQRYVVYDTYLHCFRVPLLLRISEYYVHYYVVFTPITLSLILCSASADVVRSWINRIVHSPNHLHT